MPSRSLHSAAGPRPVGTEHDHLDGPEHGDGVGEHDAVDACRYAFEERHDAYPVGHPT